MTGSSKGKGGGRGSPGSRPGGQKSRGVKSGSDGTGGAKTDGSPSGRGLKVRVKTAKRRSNSSARWLQRQLNDPFVAEAKKRGYRSRAAFKLLQMDEKYAFLSKARRIIDLGAAPGGWIQVSQERAAKDCKVVGIDLLEIEPIPGAILLVGDFLDDDAPDRLKAEMDGPADIVLSDMAAATIGHVKTDHLRIMGLVETALDFAMQVLAPGGSFVAKVIQGGAEKSLMDSLKAAFRKSQAREACGKPQRLRRDVSGGDRVSGGGPGKLTDRLLPKAGIRAETLENRRVFSAVRLT